MLDRQRALIEIENIIDDHLNNHGMSIMVDRYGLVRKLKVHFEVCLDAENALSRDAARHI